jgi:hypothetical protein
MMMNKLSVLLALLNVSGNGIGVVSAQKNKNGDKVGGANENSSNNGGGGGGNNGNAVGKNKMGVKGCNGKKMSNRC